MPAPLSIAIGCTAVLVLCAAPVSAQDTPAVQCIAAAQQKLGNLAFLRAECASRQDCTWQAPAGNASAIALLNNTADALQDCWRAAVLSQTDEHREPQGAIRTYEKTGETCKMLLSMTLGTMADGFRAACQNK